MPSNGTITNAHTIIITKSVSNYLSIKFYSIIKNSPTTKQLILDFLSLVILLALMFLAVSCHFIY